MKQSSKGKRQVNRVIREPNWELITAMKKYLDSVGLHMLKTLCLGRNKDDSVTIYNSP